MGVEQGYWDGVNLVTDVLWGDNGKGKFVDYAASYADIVLRYNGADNAGHTVQFGDKKFISHALPSGLLVEGIDGRGPLNLITRGALVNPINIVSEITSFREQGVRVDESTLLVDGASHLIMPWHILRDGLSEDALGSKKIGSTKKGIAPAYSDRYGRTGLRVSDLFDPQFEDLFIEEFKRQDRLVRLMSNEQLVGDLLSGSETDVEAIHLLAEASKQWSMKGGKMDPDKIIADLLTAREVLRPMVQNVLPIIRETVRSGGNVVGEAGQGGLLDLDQGNYPNVTSSHPGVDGFGLATNIHADKVNNVLGISKAYTTRVGSGPHLRGRPVVAPYS
jgi:adenylosuccinate synthase